MRNKNRNKGSTTFIEIVIGVLFLALLIGIPSCNGILGVGGCGPTNVVVNATIESKHVDSGEVSSYMITTNKGTFEVDNGIFLGVWNADEIYGSMNVGKKYTITTKGNKYVNFFMQEYPYIVKASQDQ